MAAATQPTQQADAARQVANIQRKLERWELTHLRALAASLHERLEQTEAALERAHADTQAAWREAEMWRDQAQNLIEDLQDAGREVGLTQSGRLVTMPMPGVDIDAVHASRPVFGTDTDNGYAVREGCAA